MTDLDEAIEILADARFAIVAIAEQEIAADPGTRYRFDAILRRIRDTERELLTVGRMLEDATQS